MQGRFANRPCVVSKPDTCRRARAFVILRSEATKNPKPLCEYYVYILTNETHRLYVETESRIWVDMSA